MEFKLPDLGEGIVDAELVQWLVAAGDTVAAGDPIAEVMTDKASVELPAPFAGTITQLNVQPGDQVKVGQMLLSYEAEGVAKAETEESATDAKESRSCARQSVERDPDPPSGDGSYGDAASVHLGLRPTSKPATSASVVAAPSVRRMARRLGVDLSTITGSGPRGRVLIDDLADHVESSGPARSAEPASGRNRSASQVNEEVLPGSRIPLRGLRRMIATRMTSAKQTIPHFGYVDECDATDLVRLRNSLKEPLAEQGIKLTYLPFIIKAVVGALQEVPICNASIDLDAEEIVVHDHYHIGVATDTPGGLVVPVIRDADRKDIPQLAAEVGQLTAAARDGQATADQLRGNTFTVSSVGGIGGLISMPIINEPAVGILGIGKIVQRPRFDDAGKIYPADIVYLSFSFDHRVVDGAIAARLGNAVVNRLANPARLLV